MNADYLAAGGLIAQRIADRAPNIKRVAALGNLYALLDAAPAELNKQAFGLLPAAFVGFDGEVIGDSAGDEFTHIALQSWLVVLVVGNYRKADSGEGVIEAAGPLLSQLVAALTGWQPDGFSPLKRQPSPRPGYLAGIGFFPLTFSTALVVEGLPDEDQP